MRDPFAEDEARRARQHRDRLEVTAPTVEKDVNALSVLQGRGWTIGADADLDAIEGQISRVAKVYSPMEWGSPMWGLLYEASEAVRTERIRRRAEYEREVEQQRRRVRSIHLAATRIEEAARELEIADGIEDRRAELLPPTVLAPIDADGMDGQELDRAIAMEGRAADHSESTSSDWTHVADVLLTAKGDAFRRYAKVARTIAAECAGEAAAHRARVQELRAVLDSRTSLESMDAEALRARVAELERIVQGDGTK